MKYLPVIVSVLPAALVSSQGTSSHCTRGRLFLSDVNSTNIQVFDLDGDNAPTALPDLLTVPGLPGQWLKTSKTGQTVTSINRGVEENSYADGGFSFVNAGVAPSAHEVDGFMVSKNAPTVIANSAVDCARPIHYVSVDDRVALFCDGHHEGNVNTTIWVVDETELLAGRTGVVFTKILEGSHHGVCVPVDDNHVLTSIATPARVNREVNASALPNGFEVVDYDGNLVDEINGPVDDPHTSCAGMHGTSVTGSSAFTFACDQNHGGVLAVSYAQSQYTSRALSYPSGFEAFRTGSVIGHTKASHVIGNFADRVTGSYHLVAFDPLVDTNLSANQLLKLEASQCAYAMEASATSNGELVLVWMPTGELLVYSVAVDLLWTLVTQVSVFDDLTECTGTTMVAGHGHAYIARGNALVDVDLTDLANVQVNSATMDALVTVNSATLAGVPDGYACAGPVVPTLVPKDRATATGWVTLHHEPSDVTAPGSAAQADAVWRLRRDIAMAVNAPVSQVYVGDIVFMDEALYDATHDHDHEHDDGEDSDYNFEIVFVDAAATEGNAQTATELLAAFRTAVTDRNSALIADGIESVRIVGDVLDERPVALAQDDHDDHDDDKAASSSSSDSKSSSNAATVGIIVALALGLLATALAAYAIYQKKEQSVVALEAAERKLAKFKADEVSHTTVELQNNDNAIQV